MKLTLTKVIYFFIIFTQLLSSSVSAQIDSKHSLNVEGICCQQAGPAISSQSNDTHQNNDSHTNHHCCSMCHFSHVTFISAVESFSPIELHKKNTLSFYYTNFYFSLVQISVFRPPIA